MNKKSNLLRGTILLILLMGSSFLLAESQGNGEVKKSAGNGEVIHTNCQNISNLKQIANCVDKIYPKIEVALKVVSKAVNIIDNRGEGFEVKDDINLKNMDRVVMHINIENAKKPITSNIKNVKIYQNDKVATIDILVSEIKENIIIYNKEKKILVNYKVNK